MTERKRRHIGRWIAIILILLLATHFFWVSLSVSAEIPPLSEYSRSRLSPGITYSTYENLPNETYSKKLAVYTELTPAFSDQAGEVLPVLVNEKYFEVYGIHVGGSGITKQHIEGRVPAIVISSKAAEKMRLDGNVVGQTLSIWGRDFTIVGVYQQPEGFLREISSDIYDRVFIPYTCYDGYPELSIDSFAAPVGTYSATALPLFGLTETDAGFYQHNDLAVEHDIMAHLPRLFASVIALILAVIAVKLLLIILRQTRRKLKESYQNNYAWAVTKQNRLYLLLRILAVIGLIAVPTALLILFPPRLILPLRYIPYDNVFELNHYAQALRNTLQLSHTNLWCGNSYFSHLFWISGTMCTAELILLTAASCIFFRRIYPYIRKLTERQDHSKTQ